MSNVDHPEHYNQILGIECIDVAEQFNFNLGSVLKYIWRAGLKSTDAHLDDLKKAQWYINREIIRLSKQLHKDKLELCKKDLFSESHYVRDEAGLGLASLDDPIAIPEIQNAIAREKNKELKKDLELVLNQLEETKRNKENKNEKQI